MAVCLAICSVSAVPGAAAAGPSREGRLEDRVSELRDQRAKLKNQRAKLKNQLADTREQRNSAWARITVLEGEGSGHAATIKQQAETIATLTVERDWLITKRDSLISERDSLITERDQALSGLPEAIKVVPLDQFWPLVLTPARAAWPCDSYYTSEGYWSLTFDSSSFCF